MIRVEEALVMRVDGSDGLRHSLEELLDLRWSSYRKAFKGCRRKFSEKKVHALRVEIRRMLSTLALLEAALPLKWIEPLKSELRDRLKGLSRLRDTHVQIDTIAEMLEDAPELRPLWNWLHRKERRLARQQERQLARARAGKAKRRVSQLIRALHNDEKAGNRARNLEEVLIHATGRAFGNVVAFYRQIRSTNVAAIHRTRVAFKKFRYMVEALARVLPGITDRQLRGMQTYQTRMGEIQDVEVLLARTEKFAAKFRLEEGAFPDFRERVLRRRARLITRFVGSAQRLLQFWPPNSHHTFRNGASVITVIKPAGRPKMRRLARRMRLIGAERTVPHLVGGN